MNTYRNTLLSEIGLNIDITKAIGSNLYDKDGHTITDCLAQYGVLALGHNHPKIKAATINFLSDDQVNFIQPFSNKENKKLTKTLLDIIGNGFTRVTYGNSGAEAVEASIKLSRIHTGRKKVLSLKRSYHGKTYVALSACGSSHYKDTGLYDDQNFVQVNLYDIDEISRLIATEEFAAFIFEPVLGEGGMEVNDLDHLKKIIYIAHKHKTVCIADEIQCGLGRCGAISYSCEHKLDADIILFSKALSGGVVPISCMLYKEDIYEVRFEKIHSSTFASGGLGSCCANVVLEELVKENGVLDNVAFLSEIVEARKHSFEKKYGHICTISGTKLLRGFHFHDPNTHGHEIITYLYNAGSIAYVIASYLLNKKSILTMPSLSSKRCLRFQPALTTNESTIHLFFDAMEEVCDLIHRGRYDLLFAVIINKTVSDDGVNYPVIRSEQSDIAPLLFENQTHKSFAFLMHPTSFDDMIVGMPTSVATNFTEAERNELVDLFLNLNRLDPTPAISCSFSVPNASGYSSGYFIMCPMLPKDMLKLHSHEKKSLLREYIKVVREHNIEVVGLGAFTSVISRAGSDIVDELKDLTVTTGNSFTAMATVGSITEYFKDRNKQKAVVVGALGSVGQTTTVGLSCMFSELILSGKKNTAKSRYKHLIEKLISTSENVSISCATDSVLSWLRSELQQFSYQTKACKVNYIMAKLNDAHCPLTIKDAIQADDLDSVNCIVSATSAGKSFIDPLQLDPAILLVDVARPSDFKHCSQSNVVEGGLVKQPIDLRYGDSNLVHLETGYSLACLSETISLALSNKKGHYSIGMDVTYEDALNIYNEAIGNGFIPKTIQA